MFSESRILADARLAVAVIVLIAGVAFYVTAIADHEGRTLFAADVYRLDQKAERALATRSEAFTAFWSQRH